MTFTGYHEACDKRIAELTEERDREREFRRVLTKTAAIFSDRADAAEASRDRYKEALTKIRDTGGMWNGWYRSEALAALEKSVTEEEQE